MFVFVYYPRSVPGTDSTIIIIMRVKRLFPHPRMLSGTDIILLAYALSMHATRVNVVLS